MTTHIRRPRAIGYARVSTDQQADRGSSLDAQESKIRLFAELHDLDLVAFFVDRAVSAKTLDRPELQRALTLLNAGAADALIVAKLDRLTRSVRDLGTLVDEHFMKGTVALMSVSEQIDTRTAAGRLVLNVLGAVSQWEREAIAERTAIVMRHKAERGEYTGGHPPFGFILVQRLTEDGTVSTDLEPQSVEQQAIARARALRAAGLSLRRIAGELHASGFTTRTGRRFEAAQIQRMVD